MIGRGLYLEQVKCTLIVVLFHTLQLKRLRKAIAAERVIIVTEEDFDSDPVATMRRVFNNVGMAEMDVVPMTGAQMVARRVNCSVLHALTWMQAGAPVSRRAGCD